MKTSASLAALALALLTPGAASAQTGLPEGASSLNETYGAWVLTCVAPEGTRRCAITHSQHDQASRQRILAAELAHTAEGTARGILVMPFGLKVVEAVSLTAPGEAPAELAFSTCLPAGCIVPLDFDAEMVATLSKGGAAELRATAVEGGKDVVFSLPLDGFGAAFTRLGTLRN